MSLSVIIPAKNEEDIILKTLNEFQNSWITNIEHEILIINDNSTDRTVELINNTSFKKLKLKLIDNTKVGLGSAISFGINTASKSTIALGSSSNSSSGSDIPFESSPRVSSKKPS